MCRGNTFRSLALAVLLQKILGGKCVVESAGTHAEAAGKNPDFLSIRCLKEQGIVIDDNHKGRWINQIDLSQFSHIVCVDRGTRHYVENLLGREVRTVVVVANEEHGGIPLLPGAKGEEYKKCIELLERITPEIAEKIRKG
ncbi:MAG: hypothetical protein NTU85_01945 [Candidatus Kaiserbacteria bacterium]|nr:hypothetical protein [Candidatus Kaiserbacteria bacterium]